VRTPRPGFCALCLDPIADVVRREPLGKNDALVAVCDSCALEEIRPKHRVTAQSMRDSRVTTPRAARIKEYRDQLVVEGVCVNGRDHGKVKPGKRVCADCDAGVRRRDVKSKAASP
jgi:hypothetical protein